MTEKVVEMTCPTFYGINNSKAYKCESIYSEFSAPLRLCVESIK